MVQTVTSRLELPLASGPLLKQQLRHAERRRRIKAACLVAPLFIFLMTTFIIPILVLLHRSIENPEVVEVMPLTSAAIQSWAGADLPGELVFKALAKDLVKANEERSIGRAGKRLNSYITGFWSLLTKTGMKVAEIRTEPASYREVIIAADDRWKDLRYWAAVKRTAHPYTDSYLLAAVDLERDLIDNIVPVSANRAIYLRVLGRTFWMSLMVTLGCLLLGYPVAWRLASLPVRYGNLLMILVLLPFWTSLLVRITSWILILQREGLVNILLLRLHLIQDPIQLAFNRFGVYVSMIHILLPFMILPIYSVMRNISPSYMRAASSLGANPFIAFFKVYLPQSLPGVSAGCLLVYILAIGYYITPALMGGPNDQMLSYFIAFFTNKSINWGMASGLAVMLLAATIVLYALFNRFIGVERLRLR